MFGAKYALAALVVVCFFNAVASDKILKIGGAIGAATIGYGIHLAPLAMILGANTIRVGHSHPPVHHKTLVHVHDHGHGHYGGHYGGYGHGW